MLFNSISFLLFFPLVCIGYFAIPSKRNRLRNLLLLAASYYFYTNWQPAYALLLLTSTAITYLAALGVAHFRTKGRRKFCLAASIILNVGVLLLFKYYNFLSSNLLYALNHAGLRIELPSFSLLLPVGISFYTFQALGYSVDVYRGRTEAERDFPTYALFVSFFPQLVAGPIERSTSLLPQFKASHRFCYENTMRGMRMMVWGYFLKLALADRCGLYVDAIFNNVRMHNGGSYLLASMLFTFQIYGDFAGYSLIAIGAARVMGFELMENFRRPYFSTSVGEFWHRWHISLSTWFRDYVYIPLGGNRVKRAHKYFNLLLTFVLSGIWHGANWTFLCWGALHGMLLCVEKALGVGRREYRGVEKLLHWGATFLTVSLAWIIFRADSMHDAANILAGILTRQGSPMPDTANLAAIALALMILLFKEAAEEWQWNIHIADSRSWAVRHLYIVLMIAYLLLFGVLGGDQFIYFQF